MWIEIQIDKHYSVTIFFTIKAKAVSKTFQQYKATSGINKKLLNSDRLSIIADGKSAKLRIPL